jgi:Protein of unknown function (DUF3667).
MKRGKIFSRRTPSKSLPVSTYCRNCGALTQGAYCHICGQSILAGRRRSLRNIVFNMLENLFSVDNKIFATLKVLIFSPGKLTREYIDGRVVRYVLPGKLFWFISILFMAVFFSQVDWEGLNLLGGSNTVDSTQTVQDAPLSIELDLADAKKSSSELNRDEIKALERRGIDYLTTYGPYLSFCVLPIFALLLMLFFHKRKRGLCYADYVIFALHLHSFIYLLWLACLLWKRVLPAVWSDTALFAVLIIVPVFYFALALCRFFGVRRALFWKLPLILFLHFTSIAILGLVVVVLFFGVLEQLW